MKPVSSPPKLEGAVWSRPMQWHLSNWKSQDQVPDARIYWSYNSWQQPRVLKSQYSCQLRRAWSFRRAMGIVNSWPAPQSAHRVIDQLRRAIDVVKMLHGPERWEFRFVHVCRPPLEISSNALPDYFFIARGLPARGSQSTMYTTIEHESDPTLWLIICFIILI